MAALLAEVSIRGRSPLFIGDHMTIKQQIATAVERVNSAIDMFDPIKVYGLFSGGHDSFSSSFVASQAKQFDGVVHINTGIGVEATRQYVRDTCASRNWNLLEYKAWENQGPKGNLDPQVYADLVKKWGFPGPGGHGMMYFRLKHRAILRLERDSGANCRGRVKKRVLLVSGCRTQESQRRMANTEEIQVEGRRIWCAAIHDWSKLDTGDCLAFAGQPRSEVVDCIHKSGECLCGAFAKPEELEELSFWPITRDAYHQIKALETEVMKLHPWGWGQRPPRKAKVAKPNPLCWSCERNA